MSSAAPSAPSSYMTHINGLRALAIIGVFIYHLDASFCPAGYFGVDLFLLISGFLLFRSLLKPGAQDHFHYGHYLIRKAWRIIPSWFAVSLAACLAAVCLIYPLRLGDIIATAGFSACGVADYFVGRKHGYFNLYSQQNPLLHLWYLSLIIQLYIIAPLLVIPLARRVSRRAAMVFLAILGLLSFAYYATATSYSLVPDSVRLGLLRAVGIKTTYYHLLPRFWEIAAGAAVLLMPAFDDKPRLRQLLGVLGLVGIGLSFYLFDTGSASAYLTVVSSLLAMRYASSGVAAWLLNCKPLQALGTISFSLYLWHWPVMSLWKYCCFEPLGVWDYVGMVILSFVLGCLSWWAVESIKTPSGSGRRASLKRCSVVLLSVAVAVMALLGVLKYPIDAASNGSAIKQPVPEETDQRVLNGLEKLEPYQLLERSPARIGSADAVPSFFIMGDSHAYHLSYALHKSCSKAGLRGVYLNDTVFPFWYLYQPAMSQSDKCRWSPEIASILLDYLKAHPEIRFVIISMYWDARLAYNPGVDWRTGEAVESGDTRKAVTGPGLGALCDQLRAIGKEVILLGDTPSFMPPAPVDEWERGWKIGREYKARFVPLDEHEYKNAFSHSLFQQLVAEKRVHYIDLAPAMMKDGSFPAQRADGEFLYSDSNHLSAIGADQVIEYLMPRLLEVMKPQLRQAPSAPESAAVSAAAP